MGDARRIDEAFQVLESVEQGSAVGSPQLSVALICGLLNALIESGLYFYLKHQFSIGHDDVSFPSCFLLYSLLSILKEFLCESQCYKHNDVSSFSFMLPTSI